MSIKDKLGKDPKPLVFRKNGETTLRLSNNEYNDDWLKQIKGARESELKLHEELARKYKESQALPSQE